VLEDGLVFGLTSKWDGDGWRLVFYNRSIAEYEAAMKLTPAIAALALTLATATLVGTAHARPVPNFVEPLSSEVLKSLPPKVQEEIENLRASCREYGPKSMHGGDGSTYHPHITSGDDGLITFTLSSAPAVMVNNQYINHFGFAPLHKLPSQENPAEPPRPCQRSTSKAAAGSGALLTMSSCCLSSQSGLARTGEFGGGGAHTSPFGPWMMVRQGDGCTGYSCIRLQREFRLEELREQRRLAPRSY
jgi:hypothetical protein